MGCGLPDWVFVSFGDLVGGGLYGVFVFEVGFVSGLYWVAAVRRSEMFLSSPHNFRHCQP